VWIVPVLVDLQPFVHLGKKFFEVFGDEATLHNVIRIILERKKNFVFPQFNYFLNLSKSSKIAKIIEFLEV
jgi:hypothetical protein